MATAKKHVQKWKLDELHPHPKQAEVFFESTAVELKPLADHMRCNSLNHPIEITSDGTIICGHQRVCAARMLGWETIDVIIRDDLEKQGPDAVVRHLIDDNRLRRQLDLLSEVRCIVALDNLYKADPDPDKWQPRPNVRDTICTELNMSPKNAGRYQHVLETPMAVQNAFSQGELTLQLAVKVAGLAIDIREQIAARIDAGENA